MDRRDLSLSQETHPIDFFIESAWLHCTGFRQFDLSWELAFSIWVTTWPNEGCELTTRRNPTDALRLRLEEAGFLTTFYGDQFVQSLCGRVPTVDLAHLMGTMKMIAVGSPDQFSTPIVLLD
jgi:hypothetical protein